MGFSHIKSSNILIKMDFNPHELDFYDFSVCPYNYHHRLHTQGHFLYHLSLCPQKQTQNIPIFHCSYNPNHIFSDLNKLRYHMPRCLDHEDRNIKWTRRMYEEKAVFCKFDKNHLILGNCKNWENHASDCLYRLMNPLCDLKIDKSRNISQISKL